jgi:hypothetical protein
VSKQITSVLTVLVAAFTTLSGAAATAFAVPGDDTSTGPTTTTTTGETRQTRPTPVELMLSPDRGEPESTVKATAMLMVQCAPTQKGTLSLSWDGDSLDLTNIATADPAGGSITFDFTVPATAKAGPHTVEAICLPPDDLQSRTHATFRYAGSAIFTVDPTEKPTLTVHPDQGSAGSPITASGTGFACGTDGVQLAWDDGSVLADQLPGAFTEHVSVPTNTSADRDHSITASCTDHPDTAVSQPFTVTPAAISASVTPGDTPSVTGPPALTSPTVSGHPNASPPPNDPPWWLIMLIVAAVITGATLGYRRRRTRPAHAGADVRAVAHLDPAPTVTVRETPAPGDVAFTIGLVPHPDPGTQTFVEVSS